MYFVQEETRYLLKMSNTTFIDIANSSKFKNVQSKILGKNEQP